MRDDIDPLATPEDWDNAVSLPANDRTDVTVAIRLDGSEFDALAECAEREGKTVTEFIRAAVLSVAKARFPSS